MNDRIAPIIQEAKRLLALQTYDPAHDLMHHEAVYATARDIATHLNSADFDPDLLHIACMWHDVISKQYTVRDHVQITADTAKYVKKLMLENNFSEAEVRTVYLAILHHEFDDTPQNAEGAILFDADKLEILSLNRAHILIAAYEAGRVTEKQFEETIRAGNAMIQAMRNRLYHDYSKKLFDERSKVLWHDPAVIKYAR